MTQERPHPRAGPRRIEGCGHVPQAPGNQREPQPDRQRRHKSRNGQVAVQKSMASLPMCVRVESRNPVEAPAEVGDDRTEQKQLQPVDSAAPLLHSPWQTFPLPRMKLPLQTQAWIQVDEVRAYEERGLPREPLARQRPAQRPTSHHMPQAQHTLQQIWHCLVDAACRRALSLRRPWLRLEPEADAQMRAQAIHGTCEDAAAAYESKLRRRLRQQQLLQTEQTQAIVDTGRLERALFRYLCQPPV